MSLGASPAASEFAFAATPSAMALQSAPRGVDIGSFAPPSGSGGGGGGASGGAGSGASSNAPDYSVAQMGSDGFTDSLAAAAGMSRPKKTSKNDVPAVREFIDVAAELFGSTDVSDAVNGIPGTALGIAHQPILGPLRARAIAGIVGWIDRQDQNRYQSNRRQLKQKLTTGIRRALIREWKENGKKGPKPSSEDAAAIAEDLIVEAEVAAGVLTSSPLGTGAAPGTPDPTPKPNGSDCCSDAKEECESICPCPCDCTRVDGGGDDDDDIAVRGARLDLSYELFEDPQMPNDVTARGSFIDGDNGSDPDDLFGRGEFGVVGGANSRGWRDEQLVIPLEEETFVGGAGDLGLVRADGTDPEFTGVLPEGVYAQLPVTSSRRLRRLAARVARTISDLDGTTSQDKARRLRRRVEKLRRLLELEIDRVLTEWVTRVFLEVTDEAPAAPGLIDELKRALLPLLTRLIALQLARDAVRRTLRTPPRRSKESRFWLTMQADDLNLESLLVDGDAISAVLGVLVRRGEATIPDRQRAESAQDDVAVVVANEAVRLETREATRRPERGQLNKDWRLGSLARKPWFMGFVQRLQRREERFGAFGAGLPSAPNFGDGVPSDLAATWRQSGSISDLLDQGYVTDGWSLKPSGERRTHDALLARLDPAFLASFGEETSRQSDYAASQWQNAGRDLYSGIEQEIRDAGGGVGAELWIGTKKAAGVWATLAAFFLPLSAGARTASFVGKLAGRSSTSAAFASRASWATGAGVVGSTEFGLSAVRQVAFDDELNVGLAFAEAGLSMALFSPVGVAAGRSAHASSVPVQGGEALSGASRAARETVRPLARRVSELDLPYRVPKTLGVRLSRAGATRVRYAGVNESPILRQLRRLPGLRNISWEQHHVFLQQRWLKPGGPTAWYAEGSAEAIGLRELGNAGWNLMPVPRALNQALGRSPWGTLAFGAGVGVVGVGGSVYVGSEVGEWAVETSVDAWYPE